MTCFCMALAARLRLTTSNYAEKYICEFESHIVSKAPVHQARRCGSKAHILLS